MLCKKKIIIVALHNKFYWTMNHDTKKYHWNKIVFIFTWHSCCMPRNATHRLRLSFFTDDNNFTCHNKIKITTSSKETFHRTKNILTTCWEYFCAHNKNNSRVNNHFISLPLLIFRYICISFSHYFLLLLVRKVKRAKLFV